MRFKYLQTFIAMMTIIDQFTVLAAESCVAETHAENPQEKIMSMHFILTSRDSLILVALTEKLAISQVPIALAELQSLLTWLLSLNGKSWTMKQ